MPTARKGKKTGKYRSKFEAQLAPSLLAAGAKYEPFALAYQLEKLYRPDWVKGHLIIELKGYFPAEDRRKMLAVKAVHPEFDIRLVFQNAGAKLYKGSKTSYAEWAEKHGFPWAHQYVPASWLQ